MKRLRRKVKKRGVEALVHGNRGKPAYKTALEKLNKVIQLPRGQYQGLNDTPLTEKLNEKEKINLSRPTVRRLLRAGGIPPVRKRGVKRHCKRRERKLRSGRARPSDMGVDEFILRPCAEDLEQMDRLAEVALQA